MHYKPATSPLFLPDYVPFMMVLAINLSTGEKAAGRSLGLRLIYRGLLKQARVTCLSGKTKTKPQLFKSLKVLRLTFYA